MNLINYDLINTFLGKFITDTVTAAAGSPLSLETPFTLTMWYNMLQVHKMFLFLNSLGCTNYQTLLAKISLLCYGNSDPFWGCISKLAKQVEGEHTTFYGPFWFAAKWMSDGFSGYMTSWIWFTSSYIYKYYLTCMNPFSEMLVMVSFPQMNIWTQHIWKLNNSSASLDLWR